VSTVLETLARALEPKPKRLPLMTAPLIFENDYFERLRRGPLLEMRELLDTNLQPLISFHADAIGGPDDDLNDELRDVLDDHREGWTRRMYRILVRAILGPLGEYQARQLNSVLKAAFNFELPAVVGNEAWLAAELARATEENVDLISALPETYVEQVSKKLGDVLVRGGSVEQVKKALEESRAITERRAYLIAVDQTNKWYGKLNELRQKSLGVRRYVWRTQRDFRVRDGHSRREGQVFSWDAIPPDVGGGEGHPGQPVRCRCWAEPDFRGVLW
jgi:SPP1 gp7 family putative phage head morphogenesis protein